MVEQKRRFKTKITRGGNVPCHILVIHGGRKARAVRPQHQLLLVLSSRHGLIFLDLDEVFVESTSEDFHQVVPLVNNLSSQVICGLFDELLN